MIRVLLIIAALLFSSSALCSSSLDVPSCQFTIDAYQQPKPHRELFLVVDRTMVGALDQTIKRDIYDHVQHYLRSGDKVQLIEFSSVQGGYYTQVTFSGMLDHNLNDEQRYTLAKSKLKYYQRCQTQQRQYLFRQFGHALIDVFKPLPKAPNTEIVASLKDIGQKLIARSTAEHRTLLIVSDMLENSDVTSFYRRGRPRSIDTHIEINKFKHHKMQSNLMGTDVYIIGLGLMENSSDYLSPTLRHQYAEFWRSYLELSGGYVRAIGQPNLLGGL